jgi:hypothetical protein
MDFRQSETMSLKKWDNSSSVIHTKDSRSECTEPPCAALAQLLRPPSRRKRYLPWVEGPCWLARSRDPCGRIFRPLYSGGLLSDAM